MHYSLPTRRFTDKFRGVVLAGGLAVWLAASSQAAEALPLWDGPAPKAAAAPAEPQPFLDVYLPAEGQANGSALVVCPGGGYGGLALGHEGQE
ncbi:MAG: hypothetical protein EBZ13_13610, partial [Planctomycetia bacterium]|nr:hypothetical protein [Planctomycetia bacterium]